MGPETRETVALLERSQREDAAETGLAPTLAAVLGATANYGFGGTFRDTAADGQAARAEGHVAHAVLVVGEVDEVLPELLAFGARQLGIVTFQLALDGVDGRVLGVEAFVPPT